MLSVERHVLDRTFESLRACGRNRDECVVYWTGPADRPGVVDDVVRPKHTAGRGWYEIDGAWITEFFMQLRATRRTTRAQVHTHPSAFVEHSVTDDCYPLAPSEGFVSIVLPHFANGAVDLVGAGIAVQEADGEWLSADAGELITWL